jgi:hypothetical protein
MRGRRPPPVVVDNAGPGWPHAMVVVEIADRFAVVRVSETCDRRGAGRRLRRLQPGRPECRLPRGDDAVREACERAVRSAHALT